MIGKNPSDPQPHFELGRLFEERGDLERAAELGHETAIKRTLNGAAPGIT